MQHATAPCPHRTTCHCAPHQSQQAPSQRKLPSTPHLPKNPPPHPKQICQPTMTTSTHSTPSARWRHTAMRNTPHASTAKPRHAPPPHITHPIATHMPLPPSMQSAPRGVPCTGLTPTTPRCQTAPDFPKPRQMRAPPEAEAGVQAYCP